MKKVTKSSSIKLLASALIICCSCVQIQRTAKIQQEIPELQADNNKESEIHVYVFQPTFRSYQETVKYEAIGSNISSFDQVLNRVKNRARKDGCEALVQVKFYRQPYGNGKLGSSFPKIEAIGVRYTE
jgi:hypothetical protein